MRTGTCQDKTFNLQAETDELIMEGEADDVNQKIVGRGKLGRVVDKTHEEIEAENPPPLEIPQEKLPAVITNEQWLDVLNKLDKLQK